jgi:hypothetical protein
MRRAAQDRAQRRPGQKDPAGDEQEDAEHDGAGVAEESAEEKLERLTGRAAVALSEEQHQPKEDDDEPGAERPHCDEGGARDHQAAEAEQDRGNHEAPGAHEPVEPGDDLLADDAALPPEPEGNGQERANEAEREADQLRMLLGPAAAPPALALSHAGRRFRAHVPGTLPGRHGSAFRRNLRRSCFVSLVVKLGAPLRHSGCRHGRGPPRGTGRGRCASRR